MCTQCTSSSRGHSIQNLYHCLTNSISQYTPCLGTDFIHSWFQSGVLFKTYTHHIAKSCSTVIGHYWVFALPCLALPCLALPCLALPCLALPCLALPVFWTLDCSRFMIVCRLPWPLPVFLFTLLPLPQSSLHLYLILVKVNFRKRKTFLFFFTKIMYNWPTHTVSPLHSRIAC